MEYTLFIGRFQPITRAHVDMAKRCRRNLIFGVIKGKKSSEDKDRNPLDFEYQKLLIKKVFPESIIMVFATGFLPDIIDELNKYKYKITEILLGIDRMSDYMRQIEYIEKEVRPTLTIVDRSPDDISASKVRESLRINDAETFVSMVPEEIWPEYNSLREKISED